MDDQTVKYDTPSIEIPLKWILNEPIQTRDSVTYEDDPETIPSILKHLNIAEEFADAEFLVYHGWLEVLVIRGRLSKLFHGAYLLIERDEYYAHTEPEMERMVASALVRFAICETTY